ncbi:response regulator [Heyndrickxia sp. NPDC080065]|uniref:response regulator n=1 Tax=Heyndrickxia sp. NPDC080065 TaxID=3390568 RepID=UPI003D057C32
MSYLICKKIEDIDRKYIEKENLMKAILVDDESLALEYLEHLLLRIDSSIQIKKFIDPLLAEEAILLDKVDVVFLDINFPEINGIELAERLLEGKPDLPIIFTTAYRDFAVQAFEINALDYLVKPIRVERLSATIKRIQKQMKTKQVNVLENRDELYMALFNQVSLKKADGTELTMAWRTKKTEELFIYLLQHHGKFVRKSFLVEILWPENETEKAYSYLYTAIYHIRKVIKEFGDCFQLKNTSEGYMLSLNAVVLDTNEFENKMKNMPEVSAETVMFYEAALNIYTGEYLQGYDYWWAEAEREKFKKWWIWASYQLANWIYDSGRLEKAFHYFQQISNFYPEEEEACFKLMQIYESMGNFLSVQQQYEALSTFLLNELNVEPSPHITEWFIGFKKRRGLVGK